MVNSGNRRTSGRVAFTYPSFLLYASARFFMVLAREMQAVAVGWQVYDITKRPLDLGLVGLAQFLPGILFFLVSGHAADRFDRRKVLVTGYLGQALCSSLLLAITLRGLRSVDLIYGVMFLVGVASSFNAPASRGILPLIVSEEHFQNAFAWASILFQAATILGPAVGGFEYGLLSPGAVYASAVVAGLAAAMMMSLVKFQKKQSRPRETRNWRTFLAGLHYIWEHKIVLGSISLDLFAVLLGGAVALLPVYAREILKTGPSGLGLLRCSPGIGAAVMAMFVAYRPLRRKAGAKMLWCVAGFGIFTIVFGVSRNLILSMAALAMVGATDMVSVVIRGVLVQLETPDEMRGRVNAVDMIFIDASNQVGQFESGATAAWLGTVPAVILGGIGTLVVTALWAWMFPELRNADTLTVPQLEKTVAASEAPAHSVTGEAG